MPSLSDTLDTLEHMTGDDGVKDRILITPTRCVEIIGRRESCGLCRDVCPSQAVQVRFPSVSIDAKACSDCCACVTVCPTSALSLGYPSQQDLARALEQVVLVSQGNPVIACQQVLGQVREENKDVNKARVLPLTCLDAVDESLLLTAVLQGAQHIDLCKGDCIVCGRGSSGAVCSLVVESCSQLLEDWGSSVQVVLSQCLPDSVFLPTQAPAEANDRREFFKDLRDRGKKAAANTVGSFVEDRYGQVLKDTMDIDLQLRPLDRKAYLEDLSRLSSYRSVVVLAQLASLGSPRASRLDNRLWAEPVIDRDACTDCGSCYRKCPTSALSRQEEGDQVWIRFSRGQCVACGLCESVCRHQALSLESNLSTDGLLGGGAVSYPLPPSPAKTYFLERKKDRVQNS